MPYSATVLRVLIASPSDVIVARDAVERALHSWNDAHSRSRSVVLMPWRWESSAVPVLGDHPQKLINLQGVDDADIVIALFGGRIGAPTPDAVSGTVEEIDRAVSGERPVHLYFSSAPLPHDVDAEQLVAVREFKKEMQTRGLYREFANPEQLLHLVWQAIEHDLGQLSLEQPSAAKSVKPVSLFVQPGSEREHDGFTSRGNPTYTTRHWVDITNNAELDAEDVTLEALSSGIMLAGPSGTTVIHSGQTRRFNLFFTLAAGVDNVIRIKWSESGEERSKEYHI